jgi:hypothetical protein
VVQVEVKEPFTLHADEVLGDPPAMPTGCGKV